MASYANITDYVDLCLGNYQSIADGSLFELASDAVDALCYGRIRKIGFDNLTKFQQEKVKKAVCLHVSFLSTYGELLNSPLSSYGINGVSMSFDAAKVVTQGNVTTNQAVMQQLRQSGLATRLIP